MILKLKALAPERNMARFYTLRRDPNLLGEIVVSSSYGRIGTHGNVKYTYFNDSQSADTYISAVIRKRLQTPYRL
jgi:predicted DNA-binding WGR domain protein